jgi:hypothetical protein
MDPGQSVMILLDQHNDITHLINRYGAKIDTTTNPTTLIRYTTPERLVVRASNLSRSIIYVSVLSTLEALLSCRAVDSEMCTLINAQTLSEIAENNLTENNLTKLPSPPPPPPPPPPTPTTTTTTTPTQKKKKKQKTKQQMKNFPNINFFNFKKYLKSHIKKNIKLFNTLNKNYYEQFIKLKN